MHTKGLKNTGMINLDNNTIQLDFFKRIIKILHDCDYNMCRDILDSYSYTQFESKVKVIEIILNSGILNKKTNVTIFGCWFGSILAAALSNEVKSINGYDMNEEVIRIAKKLFIDYKNINFHKVDIFKKYKTEYSESNLIINTSCEHMPSIKEWPYWHKIKKNTYVLFQSHNLKDINGHINCVQTMEEFINQMPKFLKIIHSEIIEEKLRNPHGGKRFTLFGYKNE